VEQRVRSPLHDLQELRNFSAARLGSLWKSKKPLDEEIADARNIVAEDQRLHRWTGRMCSSAANRTTAFYNR